MSKRKTLPFTTSPQTNNKDAKIRFKDKEFDICPRTFAAFSTRFAREFRSPSIEITDDVGVDTVTQMIKACQIEEYDMSECNILEFEFICGRWEVSVILSEISDFIESSMNSKSMIIDRLIFYRNRNLDTSEIECSIRSNFFDFLSDTKFQTLPIDLLVRVVPSDIPLVHQDRFLEFAFMRLKRDGRVCSMLFRDVDLSRASLDQIQQLCGNADFDWGFVGGSVHHTITELVSEFRREIVQESAACEERDRVSHETRQVVHVVERQLCELESGQQRLIEEFCEVQRTCDLILESIRTLSAAHSTNFNTLSESIGIVCEDVVKIKADVACDCEAGRELQRRVDELCGKFESSSDRFVKSTDSMKIEIAAERSAIDCLGEKFDKAERDANRRHGDCEDERVSD
jgi:hypothetical protein